VEGIVFLENSRCCPSHLAARSFRATVVPTLQGNVVPDNVVSGKERGRFDIVVVERIVEILFPFPDRLS
jgi:hypothetical protein